MNPTVEMIDAGWKAGPGLNKLQVERILVAALAAMHAPAVRVLAEKDKRIAELECERYKLAYAITGGEDAPGLLDTIDVDGLVKMLRNGFASHMEAIDRATAAKAEAATLRALLAEAEKALEPFVDASNYYSNGQHRPAAEDATPCGPALLVGHLHTARAVSAKIKEAR